jgi:peptide/nickel transport system substrate-binding protein
MAARSSGIERVRKAAIRVLAAFGPLLVAGSALAQKPGGILKMYSLSSPASVSTHEEVNISVAGPMMSVFNNLVVFDQHAPQIGFDTIVPDLAARWSWNQDGTALGFALRQGVKWHDGKPFTATDVKCTWDLLTGHAKEQLRVNPRKSWYQNLEDVTVEGEDAVTFHLKQPQPALLVLLAAGLSPVYPCHVPARDMRRRPIGTGPFKFIDFKPNEGIKLARNPTYWKERLPYLDGIEYTIVPNLSTAILAFVAGRFDLAFPYSLSPQLVKDVERQSAQAICRLTPGNIYQNVILNRTKPPFDNADLRRAVALTLDRKAFIDILSQGEGDVGGIMQPPPAGGWGMPADMLQSLPGYGSDVATNRSEARQLMQRLGYGLDNRLKLKVSTQDAAQFRDPATILIDQMKEIYIDAELETVDPSRWLSTLLRKDYVAGLVLSGSGVDPDQNLYLLFGCRGALNYDGYCNAKVDELLDRQSRQSDLEARKRLVWEVQKILAEDYERPAIFYPRDGSCWYPRVKNMTLMVNTIFNGWRMEDVWLDE